MKKISHFDSEYFDLIFCGNLIELVIDPDHLLEELYRVLSPQGYLIITFPNLCAWASRIAVFLGFQPYYDIVSRKYDVGKFFIPPYRYKQVSKGFIRLYSLRAFKQLCTFYGFKIIKIIGARENSLPCFLRSIDFFLSYIPSLAFQIICVLKKQ